MNRQEPTLITTTLFNAILNPYPGIRPKNPQKIYNMKRMFEKVMREHPVLPERVAASTANRRVFVDSIQIDELYACLPGGRGCIGRERMGRKLLDRQVARFDAKGLKTNPRHDAENSDKYGFLQLIGTIHYKDGKTSKINIPIEPSGVVGLRTGASSLALINPERNVNSAGKNLLSMVNEIQDILFGMLGIRETAPPNFGMINGMFNIYSNKKGKDRPKMSRFVQVVREIQRQNPMILHYNKPTMPWMRAQQGVPSVMKAIYKPVVDNERHKDYRRNQTTLPTVTLSPYGHVEIMGAKSVESMINAYTIITQSAANINISVNTPSVPDNTNTPTRKPRQRHTVQFPNSSMVVQQRGKQLFIDNKLCDTLPKPVITRLAQEHGIPFRGTKSTVCERLFSVMTN